MTYGYARCSTNEDKQDINRQIRELKAAGAEEVVFEFKHGDAKIKQNLQMLLETAQEQDTIITLEVSRLSRSTQQLCEIVNTIKEKRLRLVIVGSLTIDCRNGDIDPMSQAFIQMSAVFAELELSMIHARVKSGMQNAKAKGKKIGRPHTTKENIPAVFFKHFPSYSAGNMNISELARICGLAVPQSTNISDSHKRKAPGNPLMISAGCRGIVCSGWIISVRGGDGCGRRWGSCRTASGTNRRNG